VTTPDPSLHLRRRERDLDRLASGEPVDLLVVGGGITGAGVALDAAARGLSVALLERRDLANGTSRWSSKLVHGGIRYLAHGDVRLAQESATERGVLLEHTAPHLTRPLGFVAPVGVGFRPGRAALTWAAFGVGNLLRVTAGTGRATLPPPRLLSAARVRRLAPALRHDGLRGGVLTFDGQLTDDARLVVAVARTAAAAGASIVTYAEVEEIADDGAVARDDRSGGRFEVRARQVVNATGVWATRLHPEIVLCPSRGAHLVVDAARFGYPRVGLTVPVPGEHNRFVFAVPQPGTTRMLVGLTDDPVDVVSDDPLASEADEAFLVEVVSDVLADPIRPDDVLGSFAGLRPLLAGADGPTADLSRHHRIVERADGLLTIVGGKLTTYRRMAEDVVDRVVARLGGGPPSPTARFPLVGAAPREVLATLPAGRHLVDRYGTEAVALEALVRRDPPLGEPVVDGVPTQLVELLWGVRHEGALTVDDLLDRRTRVGLVADDRAAALPVAQDVLARADLTSA
jgi:glycerol-3-phosphate dehydrogenase